MITTDKPEMICLPWLARNCTHVFAITIEQTQIDRAQPCRGGDPLELAAKENHGVVWEWLPRQVGAAVFGEVEVVTMHQDLADWYRAWQVGRQVYPITFLIEEF